MSPTCRVRIALAGLLAVCLCTSGWAQALSYEQRKAIRDGQREIRNVMITIQNVESPADVDALMRKIRAVEDNLAQRQVPIDDASAAALLKQIAEASAVLRERAEALGVRAATEPPPGGPAAERPREAVRPPPPEASPRLSYQDEKRLRDAEYFLSQVEASLPRVQQGVRALEGDGDGSAITAIEDSRRFLEDLSQKLENANTRLESLPAGHRAVQPLIERYAESRAALDAAMTTTDRALATQRSALDPNNFPDFRDDLAKLKILRRAYGQRVWFEGDPTIVRDLWSPLADNRTWVEAAQKRYRPLIQNDAPGAREFVAESTWFGKATERFERDAESFARRAPSEISQLLARATTQAKHAVTAKRPIAFGGEIRQDLERADTMLASLRARPQGHPELPGLESQLRNTQASIDALRAELRSEIRASTRTPSDVYRGTDRDRVMDMIRAAWARRYPKDEVLKVCLPAAQWDRTKGLEWATHEQRWEVYDRSVLPARVIVRTSREVATIYTAFVNRDNLAGKLSVGVETRRGDYVIEEMLIANLK